MAWLPKRCRSRIPKRPNSPKPSKGVRNHQTGPTTSNWKSPKISMRMTLLMSNSRGALRKKSVHPTPTIGPASMRPSDRVKSNGGKTTSPPIKSALPFSIGSWSPTKRRPTYGPSPTSVPGSLLAKRRGAVETAKSAGGQWGLLLELPRTRLWPLGISPG